MLCGAEEQLTSPDTPEVRVHYDRLRSLGRGDIEARELIATVLTLYIWYTMRRDDYAYSDYVAELAKLPEIDWQEDENENG
jgi:hypothetical protein